MKRSEGLKIIWVPVSTHQKLKLLSIKQKKTMYEIIEESIEEKK